MPKVDFVLLMAASDQCDRLAGENSRSQTLTENLGFARRGQDRRYRACTTRTDCTVLERTPAVVDQ